MSLVVEASVLVAVAILLVYYYLTKNHDYWKVRGVPFIKPTFLLGNMGDLVLQRRALAYFLAEIYDQHVNEKVVGIFSFLKPGLVIRDPDLVHKILVTDFHSFRNNDLDITEDVDPIMGRNIFFQKDELWKKNRALLTPAFTVGKIKNIFLPMTDVAEDLVKFLSRQEGKQVQLKHTMARYTSEVVARCGLGIDGRNLTEEVPKMMEYGKQIFEADTIKSLKFTLLTMMPNIMKYLNVRIVTQELTDYFNSILHDVIVHRQENDIKSNDLIQFLIEVKRKTIEYEKGNIQSSIVTKTYTDDDILSGCIMFFIEGYETSSVALSFMMHSLATHQAIQMKLREELDAALTKNNNQLTYELIAELPYLNAFILESHRMYPVLYSMSKACTEDYELDLGEGRSLKLSKGTSIMIPVVSLHHDPRYWEEPEKFKPERFFNNHDSVARAKGFYMPFGDGPRMCIGTRIASTMTKVALVSILREFDIVPSASTPDKIIYAKKSFLMSHEGGLFASFIKRQVQPA